MWIIFYCSREYGFGYYTDHCTGMANSFLESEWNTIFERVKLLPTTYMFWDGRGRDLVHILSCSRNATLLERSAEIMCRFQFQFKPTAN